MSDILNPPGFAPIAVSSFSALPDAANNEGQICRVAGLGVGGFSYWVSTGVFWRPWPESVTLASEFGTQAAPIATLANSETRQYFTLPENIVIPREAIYPGCFLEVFAAFLVVRNGTGFCFPFISLESASVGATPIWQSGGLTSGVAYAIPPSYPTQTAFNSRASITTRFNTLTGGGLSLSSVGVIANDIEDVEVKFGSFSGAVATTDSYALLAYTVILR